MNIKKVSESLSIKTIMALGKKEPSKGIKLLARYIAHHGVRNTKLEKYHTGSTV